MSKYTPGPWFAIDDSDKNKKGGDIGHITIANQDQHGEDRIWIGDAKIYGVANFPDKKTGIVNGRLMAAAPELLEALQEILPYVNDLEAENFTDPSAGIFQDAKLTKAVRKIEEAIAKAIGEKEEA
jgi:hypothetical protein